MFLRACCGVSHRWPCSRSIRRLRRQEPDVVILRLGPAKFEETAVWPTKGPGRSPARRVTFPAQRGGENRSPRIKRTPNVESRHQLRYRRSRRMHHTQGFQEKNLSKARFSTFQVAQSKNTYMWAVLTHWLLQLRVNLHFPRRYWPMGCCFLVGSRFYRRFKRWYKGLKSRVVQVKYEEKGVTLLWI